MYQSGLNKDKIDLEMWKSLLTQADVNGDGVIDYQEFKGAITLLLKDSVNMLNQTKSSL